MTEKISKLSLIALELPHYNVFSFSLTEAEQKKYKHYTKETVKAIKYLETLPKKLFEAAFKEATSKLLEKNCIR